MARRSGLGKGLGSLIPTEVSGDHTSALTDIPVSAIRANAKQPRASFDEDSMASLTASIREVGILQPILVRPAGNSTYELIAGERRWRAARRAGLPTVPAIVRDASDVDTVAHALIENLHRKDLNALEEAGAYQQLIEDFGLTHEQLSAQVGKSRATITNILRLFQLPPSVQKLITEGQLTAGHARALLGTPDRAFQEALARKAVAEQLSVRAVEEAIRARSQGPVFERTRLAPPTRKLRPPGILELEELLSAHLDTRVKVDLGPRKGRVVIDFATLEDLERIYRAMTEPPDTDSPDTHWANTDTQDVGAERPTDAATESGVADLDSDPEADPEISGRSDGGSVSAEGGLPGPSASSAGAGNRH